MRFIIGLILLAFGSGLVAAQEIRYVNDYLIITLRAGQGSEYKILKTLPSGTRLEVLDVQGDFSQVRTGSGLEGWVLTQYLTDKPAARERLREAQAEVAALMAANEELSTGIQTLRTAFDRLQGEHRTMEDDYARIDSENKRLQELAARPLELAQDNESLRAQLGQLRIQGEDLSAENARLQTLEVQWWFMAGGGVLLMGVIIGLILPMFGRRKRSTWH